MQRVQIPEVQQPQPILACFLIVTVAVASVMGNLALMYMLLTA